MSGLEAHLAALLAGTLLDRLVGDPDWLWRRLPHPVVLVGRVVEGLERRLNRAHATPGRRRANGVAAATLLVGGAAAAGLALQAAFARLGLGGWLGEALVVAVLLAGRSLADHVERVAAALRDAGLPAGRRAVAMIVGRDPEQLDEAGVCRAAIESLAENASDGLVAPWLFYLVLGLPGLLAYKALNTADSMIGHMNDRYRAFGWAAARLDDVANWPAARLTVVLFALAAGMGGGRDAVARVIAVSRRDAPSHRSPNAGWPEAAMAAALGLALGGPRRYGELAVDAPMLNGGARRDASPRDVAAGLALFGRLMDMLALAAALLLLAALLR